MIVMLTHKRYRPVRFAYKINASDKSAVAQQIRAFCKGRPMIRLVVPIKALTKNPPNARIRKILIFKSFVFFMVVMGFFIK